MQAWMLDEPGKPIRLREVATPEPREQAVLVRMEAVPLLSYTRSWLQGMSRYMYPPGPFSPGTNGIGRVEAVGRGVHGLMPGQRVAVNPYWVSAEATREPDEILIGLTGMSTGSASMQAEFPHGSWRELAEFPAATVIPLDGLEHIASERLATLPRFAIPFGGLRRGRLLAGETVAVHGASGSFGSAAVLDALAMGAGRVVAIGRNLESLQRIEQLGGERVAPVQLSGNVDVDARAIREAAGGSIDLGFDQVGRATDPHGTLATFKSLRRRGRLVLMGSMSVPLPIDYGEMLARQWELIGHFMYSSEDYLALVNLVRSGLLSLDAIDVTGFPFADMEKAIDAAGSLRGMRCAVVRMATPRQG